jgi:ankyrin repeat protein
MLHYAASHNDVHIVWCLIKAGADPSIQDKYSFSADGLAMRDE